MFYLYLHKKTHCLSIEEAVSVRCGASAIEFYLFSYKYILISIHLIDYA